jgi:hypothetical protein
MIFVEISRIIFKVLNFEFINFNNIVFIYFCLQSLKLNEFPIVKKVFLSEFVMGTKWDRLIFGFVQEFLIV